ncbi:MAG: FixH family protein [Gammaproteobacteria bacterium]|nr:FixH family protein [Gammaproteobacteria bacterium]
MRLVSLVHTSDSKLYRVGVDHAGELKDGFPADAAELFDFEVVILGSVEAARLDPVRQELLAEFVGRRGGGLLLLGGRYAFAEGGYADTRMAGVMPVVLGEASVAADAVRVAPTRQALRHPLFRDFPQQDWQSLPALSVINPITRLKPGASLLLSGEGDGGRAPVAFAAHRYGRGRVAAFPVRNSWRWQMHADASAGDTTHELFWRRLARWLASSAGGRVVLESGATGVPGRAMPIVARVMDEDYRPLADARVTLTVDTPTGERLEQRLARVPGGEGRYEGRFIPAAPGRHDLHASVDGSDLSTALPVMVAAAGDELAGAGINETLLARLAEATGGAYHRADEANALAAAITIPEGGATEVRRLPLWDMPALLLLALLLACADWALEAPRRVQVKRWFAILLLAPSLAVQAGEAPGRHLAVISGIGGEEFYDELFRNAGPVRWSTPPPPISPSIPPTCTASAARRGRPTARRSASSWGASPPPRRPVTR